MRAQTPAPEDLGEGEEGGVEEGQSGQGEEDEANAHHPVVGPLGRGVARQVLGVADHDASRSASASVSLETSLGPLVT